MSNLKIDQMVLGMVSTNCYLLSNKETKEVIIIDPADQANRIIEKCKELGVKPVAILLTHGHFDHMTAAGALKEFYKIPVYAHKKEEELLSNASMNLSASWATPVVLKADRYVEDKDLLFLAGFSIEVIYSPGHTIGSVCYYICEEKVLISGDTLFCESLGRTDFPTSSTAQIIQSIRERLFPLPEEVTVYPGHDQVTSIGHEKQYNPVATYQG